MLRVASDKNLWYFRANVDTWAVNLLDSVDLKVDLSRPQAFNFCVVWGRYSGGPCWFSSTEEGTLWMGTAPGDHLSVIGYQTVTTPLGSTLAFNSGAARLAMVGFNLYEFTTLRAATGPRRRRPRPVRGRTVRPVT